MLLEMGVRMWARADSTVAAQAPQGESIVAERVPLPEPPRTVATRVSPAQPIAASMPDNVDAGVPADWLVFSEPLDGVAVAPAPLAGEQERLLANMLHAVRVSRDAPARTGRACHVVLGAEPAGQIERALERVAPRVVLLLGRAAAQTWLGVDEPLGRLRGVVHERAGVKIVVTFALAYLLRHPAEKAKAWADLCLAVRALEAEPA
jgi:DNA polymerase